MIRNFIDEPALLLVDSERKIVYSNDVFRELSQSSFLDLKSINCEPNLNDAIASFFSIDVYFFKIDIFFNFDSSNKGEYQASCFKILIENKKYVLIILESLKEFYKLQDKFNNMHIALENSKTPIAIADSKANIIFCSSYFEETFNFSLIQHYKKNLIETLRPYINDETIDSLKEAITNKNQWKAIINVTKEKNKKTSWSCELFFIKGLQSENDSFIFVAKDITFFLEKNEILEESERIKKSIIDNISDILFIIEKLDGSYCIESANENFYSFFKISKEFQNKTHIEKILEEELYLKIKPLLDNFQKNSSSSFEYKHRFTQKTFQGRIAKFADEKRGEIFIVSLQDVTELIESRNKMKEAYQKELRLNNLKTAFLANMSHEIRTPINAISGYAELIEGDLAAGEYESALEMIEHFKDAMKRLLNLVDDIIEVSLIESYKTVFEFKFVNPNQIAEKVYLSLKPLAEAKGLEARLSLDDSLDNAYLDPLKFEKIIKALFENAIKYTPQGFVSISLKNNNNGYFTLIVEDSGIGIKKEFFENMFKPFSREEEVGHTREYEGAGLGLTLVHNYTINMKGVIDIQSEKDKGSKFILTFPIKQDK